MEPDQTLTLVNYHIVCGRDFSQPTEPIITFIPLKKLVYINAACFRRLPEMEYVHFAVYDREKRLILKPCNANERDCVRVKSASTISLRPKRIRCDEFMRKVMLLMGWDIRSRYKARGYIFASDKEKVLLFDLASALVLSPDADMQQGGKFSGISAQGSGNPLLKTFMRDTEIDNGNTEVISGERT